MSGGLIPQARQGASGVLAFAETGSKFKGTGFENEQIGQIHVAFDGIAGAGELKDCRRGLPSCDPFKASYPDDPPMPEEDNTDVDRRWGFG